MNKETILSRQILTYMLSLTFIIIAIAVVGSYLFYSFLIDYLPGGAVSGSEDDMTLLDWLWIMIDPRRSAKSVERGHRSRTQNSRHYSARKASGAGRRGV